MMSVILLQSYVPLMMSAIVLQSYVPLMMSAILLQSYVPLMMSAILLQSNSRCQYQIGYSPLNYLHVKVNQRR